MGVDVVLHPGFSLTADPSRPALKRQKSRMTKVSSVFYSTLLVTPVQLMKPGISLSCALGDC